MSRTRSVARFALLASLSIAMLAPRPGQADTLDGSHDAGGTAPRPADGSGFHSVVIEAGSGRVLRFRGAAASVFAADPKVAEVRPASPSSLFVFGVGAGRTTIAAMDAAGRPIAQFAVTVRPSAYAADAAQGEIGRTLPDSAVSVRAVPNGLVLSGQVATPEAADQAAAAARAFLSDKQTLDDRLSVGEPMQVSLRVRIAEMSRTLTRELGIDWQATAQLGKYAAIGLATNNPLAFSTVAASTLSGGYNFNSPGKQLDLNGVIDALSEDQLVHVLAEPNLTAMSGEPASFLVGGEFPIPVSAYNDQVTVDFKQYGISLSFVPTVLSNGRINLHVRPEVSELTTEGAVQIGVGNNNSIQIPALTVRRADTTVELGSGQSFAIAGLLQENTSLTGLGLPFLGDLPILGALFRSDSFQRGETELVIVVTPYIVRPVSDPAALHLPSDGWRPPSDLERILLLRQSARETGAAPPHIPGDAGFVIE